MLTISVVLLRRLHQSQGPGKPWSQDRLLETCHGAACGVNLVTTQMSYRHLSHLARTRRPTPHRQYPNSDLRRPGTSIKQYRRLMILILCIGTLPMMSLCLGHNRLIRTINNSMKFSSRSNHNPRDSFKIHIRALSAPRRRAHNITVYPTTAAALYPNLHIICRLVLMHLIT